MTKKLFAAISIAVLAITGCSDKNMERQDPEDAKTYFINAAENTMKDLDAANFTEAFAFIDSTIVALDESDAPDSLRKVMGRTLKGLLTVKKDTTVRKYKAVVVPDNIMDIRYTRNGLFSLSAFNNLYTVDAKGNCTVADSKALSVVLNNSKLGKIELTITKSSKETYVKLHEQVNDTTDYDLFKDVKYGQVGRFMIEDGVIAVKVPENIKLTATLNGKEIVSTTVNAHLDVDGALMYNSEYDMDVIRKAKGSLSFTFAAAGYKMGLEQAAVDTKDAKIKIAVYKGKKTLVAVEGKVKGYQIIKNAIDKTKAVKVMPKKYGFNAESASVNVNIHDEVHAKVNVDWETIGKFMSFDPAKKTQAEVDAFLNGINEEIEAGVYFADDTKQADVILQAVKKDGSYSLIPCLQFTKDESIYTLEEYFTSKEFTDVILEGMQLMSDFMAIMPNFGE